MRTSCFLARGAAVGVLFVACVSAAADTWTLEDMVGADAAGRPVYRPKPMDEAFRNPISEADERAFRDRARQVIAAQADIKANAGNTYFENEKRTYGYLMAHVLAGREEAIAGLQNEDAQAEEWHRETHGIDFYACFTLKHQTRKFFYFGDLLDPAYRRRMVEGAKAWTAKDPMRRPHYAFKGPGGGWGPDRKNSWVDVRSTENLYLMRVTSVYLFAEATGNRQVCRRYKDEIARYARTLYRVGMGEWDSENYHGHSIAPLCNLYDFARDDEVRLLAKACLDWIFAAGAVKYWRGGFNGPTKRDYNHVQPFGGSAANMLWLHFGECPVEKTEWESDEVHLITSAYRPPPAVRNLAGKRFDKPVELFAAKPPYSATTGGDAEAAPEYLETQYFGRTFQMGSLPSGTSEDGGDVNGFKILVHDDERGAATLQCVPGPDPRFVGSPKYQKGKVSGPNRVGQYANLAVWLVRAGDSPWRWVVPDDVRVTEEDGVTLLECDRTWVAIRPLGTTPFRIDDGLTREIASGKKAPFPGHQVLAAKGKGGTFCGLAVEVGEKQSHASFAAFRKAALAAEVDTAKLDQGIVQYKASDGKWLGFHWHDAPHDLGVWRNGKRHDWRRHAAWLYRPAGADAAGPAVPISARWGSGTLYVEAGGEAFACTVADDGTVTFANGSPGAVRGGLPAAGGGARRGDGFASPAPVLPGHPGTIQAAPTR